MARRSKGAALMNKLLVTGNAISHAPPDVTHRVGPYIGGNPAFLDEPVSAILDYVTVYGRPGQTARWLCRYQVSDEMEEPPKVLEGFSNDNKTAAFGGLHKFVYGDHFEEINHVPHLRVVDDVAVEGLEETVEKEALFDIDGNKFNDRYYDSIKRYDNKGLVDDDTLIVKEGDKYGIVLGDGSLFGGELGMQEGEIELKEFLGKVYLHVKKDGKELYITRDGKEAYGGRNAKIEEFKIGNIAFALATNDDGKICPFSEENEELYGGWCKKLEEYNVADIPLGLVTYDDDSVEIKEINRESRYGGRHLSLGKQIPNEQLGPLLECYDKEGLIIRDFDGNNHYGQYHKDKSKKGATLVRSGIDPEVLLRFLEEEVEEKLIKYWRADNTLAYGGAHEEELFAGEKGKDEKSVMKPGQERIQDVSDLAVEGRTQEEFVLTSSEADFIGAKQFRNGRREEGGEVVAPGKVCYTTLTGGSLFGESHTRQTDYFRFKGEVFLGFEDEGKGFIYTDLTGTPVFTREITNEQGVERTAYHPKAIGVKIITLNEKGEVPDNAEFENVRGSDSVIMPAIGGRQTHAAFLETNEPIGKLSERIGRAFRHRGGLTYYSLSGQRFWSIKDVQKNYKPSKDPMISLLEAREIHRREVRAAEEAARRDAKAQQPPEEEPGPSEPDQGAEA
ncbi:hypothetical protein KY360_01870 [Candidatus Woesearchaeota archaeon]|nr:hypothetical protein [Candidatus Woesearchaeota archaeon]